MMATVGFLKAMVLLALSVTILTPIILLVIWIRDWMRKELW
jgi:hypothetical protein